MCIYPRLIRNRKYVPNKKNGGQAPPVHDKRTEYVPIGCQNCIECRRMKAREWQARLTEDIKTNRNGKFITLTYSNEAIKELEEYTQNQLDKDEIKANKMVDYHERSRALQRIKDKRTGYGLDNEIATNGVRLFLERWRKQHKISLRHWLITELGHQGTENIHIHGIIWDKINWTNEMMKMKIQHYWKYGHVWVGEYVNTRTVNYIIKYVTKTDQQHQYYKSKILTSAGIGNNYTTTANSRLNKYNTGETKETYRTPDGNKVGLPIYWRNKIYSEEEREKLWIEKLDKNTRYVLGQKIDISKGIEGYNKLLKQAQEKNKQLGYGSDEKNWTREQYETQRRKMLQEQRIKNASGGVIQKDIG